MVESVLCICMGNICRSPLAEAILRDRFATAGVDISIDSAGTGGWHAGDPPDQRAIVAGRLKGYELGNQVARQVSAADFGAFDLILVMDEQNLKDIELLRPSGDRTEVRLISADGKAVPDPYYSGKFGPVIDMLETAVDDFMKTM